MYIVPSDVARASGPAPAFFTGSIISGTNSGVITAITICMRLRSSRASSARARPRMRLSLIHI